MIFILPLPFKSHTTMQLNPSDSDGWLKTIGTRKNRASWMGCPWWTWQASVPEVSRAHQWRYGCSRYRVPFLSFEGICTSRRRAQYRTTWASSGLSGAFWQNLPMQEEGWATVFRPDGRNWVTGRNWKNVWVCCHIVHWASRLHSHIIKISPQYYLKTLSKLQYNAEYYCSSYE